MKGLLWFLLLVPSLGHSTIGEAILLYDKHHYEDALLEVSHPDTDHDFYWAGRIKEKLGDKEGAIADYDQVIEMDSGMNNMDPGAKRMQGGDMDDVAFYLSSEYPDAIYRDGLLSADSRDFKSLEEDRKKLKDLGKEKLANKLPSQDTIILTNLVEPHLADMRIYHIAYAGTWARVRCVEANEDQAELDTDNFHMDYFFKMEQGKWKPMNHPDKDMNEGKTSVLPKGLPKEFADDSSYKQKLIELVVADTGPDRQYSIGQPSDWKVDFKEDWGRVQTDGPAGWSYYFKMQSDGSWKAMNEPAGEAGMPMDPVGAPAGF